MAFKLIIRAVASAGIVSPLSYTIPATTYARAPVVAKTVAVVNSDYDPNPNYSYAYDVQDGLTGDNKNQQESRQGDVVQGSYSLTDPDGTRRTVEYTADPHNGFNAVVHREPFHVKAVVAHASPVVAKYAVPVATYAAHAPVVAHATTVAYASHAAPLSYAKVVAPVAFASHAPVVAHAPIATYSRTPAISYASHIAPAYAYHH